MKKMKIYVLKTSHVKTEEDGGPSKIDCEVQLFDNLDSAKEAFEKEVKKIKKTIVKSVSKYGEWDDDYDYFSEEISSFEDVTELDDVCYRDEEDHFWYFMDTNGTNWDSDGILSGYEEVRCYIEPVDFEFEEGETIWSFSGIKEKVESSDEDEEEE